VFLGVPLAGVPPSWEALDLVRVAGGRITERRAAGGCPVVPLPLAEGTLARPAEAGIVRLARFTFAPGGEQPEAPDLGPLLLTVEAGILRAEVEVPAALTRGVAAGTGVPPNTEVMLRPGDGLVVPPGARHRFRNAEPTPAVVVAATLLPWHGPGVPDDEAFLWPVAGTPDVTAHLLAEGEFVGLPTGPTVIRLGRLTLPGHAGLEPHAATVPHLTFVEMVTLDAVTAGGPPDSLSAGTAVLTQFGAAASLRNVGDGQLVVLLVTIAPIESASQPAGVLQQG
jgi:quercetin dioxygenase-like cupin family protein